MGSSRGRGPHLPQGAERELERVSRRYPIDINTVERIAVADQGARFDRARADGTERRVREEMIDALGAAAPARSCCTPSRSGPRAARVRAAEEALSDARLALDLVPVHVQTMPFHDAHHDRTEAPAGAASRSWGRVAAAVVIGVVASLVAVAGELP